MMSDSKAKSAPKRDVVSSNVNVLYVMHVYGLKYVEYVEMQLK